MIQILEKKKVACFNLKQTTISKKLGIVLIKLALWGGGAIPV